MASRVTRPRLLFLCQTLPYPPDGGVWIRTYHVIRLLSRAFDITALCFERARTSTRGATADITAGVGGLSDFARVEVFRLPQKHSRVRYVRDHVRSLASGQVYTRFLYDSAAFRQRLARLLATEPFDLVHVDSLDLAQYLEMCDGTPTVCVHHDIESDLLRRRAAVETSAWRRAYVAHQSRLMDAIERRWAGRVALNVVMSERDGVLLHGKAAAVRSLVIPNGVDVDEFRPDATAGTGVAYVGGTSPFPNADALHFFCEQILPHLIGRRGSVPVHWIGRATEAQQVDYRSRFGVELTGYVDDVRPLMRAAACHIVPLRAGGGTRLKILNSWAMGKAVVSTSVGCHGLAAVDGVNILIRDEPRAFAEAVLSVLADDRVRERLGRHGRETAERRYSWEAIGDAMIEAYRSLLSSRSRMPHVSSRPAAARVG